MNYDDQVRVSRRIDVAWDSERHELIILGRRFKLADPEETEQDRADDTREIFYALTEMNRQVIEVEGLLEQIRAVVGHHLLTPLRQQLLHTMKARDFAAVSLDESEALLREAYRELATIEAITVSPSGVDGLLDLVNRIKAHLNIEKGGGTP